MMTQEELEKQQALQEFANASESERADMIFHSVMCLLADAVEANDVEMIKPYARLITEMYFDEGDE
jgi:phosphoribosyl-ATP pyrophosphohydrolase